MCFSHFIISLPISSKKGSAAIQLIIEQTACYYSYCILFHQSLKLYKRLLHAYYDFFNLFYVNNISTNNDVKAIPRDIVL